MTTTDTAGLVAGQLVRHRNTDDIGTFVRMNDWNFPVIDFGIGDETIDPWYIEPADVHYVHANGEVTT